MRSRAARFTLSITAWIALGAAAFFLITTEQKITERQAVLRSFDLHAREVTFALADAKAGQQAYVASGQSLSYWVPKVATLAQEVAGGVDTLRGSVVSDPARQALLEASAAITEFGNIDKRVRDYLRTDESLMAGDVAFTEGGDAAARAALQIETARISEHQAFDADEATLRRLEAYALGGAVGLAALILAVFGLARSPGTERAVSSDVDVTAADPEELPLRHEIAPHQLTPTTLEAALSEVVPVSATLKAAAELCTEFGRVHDPGELKLLLGRAAQMLDASGLVVWLGSATGADLQPVMAHGYSDQVLAMMRAVPRTADNAAAAAYRSSTMQVVNSRPGQSLGAVVAPLLSADGCIGALTAEIRDGSEMSEDVQSLASIFAAQLAGALTPSTAAETAPRTATATG